LSGNKADSSGKLKSEIERLESELGHYLIIKSTGGYKIFPLIDGLPSGSSFTSSSLEGVLREAVNAGFAS
jgi:hypothetical protein